MGKKIRRITTKMLIDAGADPNCGSVRTFREEWPHGAELTEANLDRAIKLGLPVGWLGRVVDDLACGPYREAIRSAEAVYERTCSQAWAACEEAVRSAEAACGVVVAQADAAYDEAIEEAEAAYREAVIVLLRKIINQEAGGRDWGADP